MHDLGPILDQIWDKQCLIFITSGLLPDPSIAQFLLRPFLPVKVGKIGKKYPRFLFLINVEYHYLDCIAKFCLNAWTLYLSVRHKKYISLEQYDRVQVNRPVLAALFHGSKSLVRTFKYNATWWCLQHILMKQVKIIFNNYCC